MSLLVLGGVSLLGELVYKMPWVLERGWVPRKYQLKCESRHFIEVINAQKIKEETRNHQKPIKIHKRHQKNNAKTYEIVWKIFFEKPHSLRFWDNGKGSWSIKCLGCLKGVGLQENANEYVSQGIL